MIHVVRCRSRRPLEQSAEVSHFSVRMGEQVGYLRFQGPCIYYFAERRVGCKRQQVTRNIEGPGLESALVSFLLHLRRFGRNLGEIAEHLFRKRFILRKKTVNGSPVEFSCSIIYAEIRRVVAAFSEVLITSGALLPVPALLIGDHNGR